MNKTLYITTTLPYVNAKPHVGFASEIIRADVLARFWRSQGYEVFFNTGTDEHGQKIYQKAIELDKDPMAYCDELVESFKQLRELLDLSYDNFIRTTDEHHVKAAQKFWEICDQNGYIYKKNYKVKYCVGCELEKTDSELEHGRCPIHPNQEIEIIEEENYFFKFSQFSEKLKVLYSNNPEFVLPEKRFREIKAFVERGLEDFSISRLKSKMPWGVPVPNDETQVMYVWFDALVNYISAIGWPEDMAKFEKYWPVTQVCGKDNLRQQSAMWQAMLMAADLPNSERIFINGFINVGGQKMSKSLGNVIMPEEMVARYGIDGTRYLLLTMGIFGEDMDITWEKMDEKYNADLANGLGNLASRIIKLSERIESQGGIKNIITPQIMNSMKFEQALGSLWQEIANMNKYIEDNKPWELAKTDRDSFEKSMTYLVSRLFQIAMELEPFMPETSKEIILAIENKNIKPLFQRIKQ